MTITINLSSDTAEALAKQARAEGRPAADLAAEAVSERYEKDPDEDDFPLDAEAMEAIRQGLADIEAGRTSSLEDSRARIEAVLAAHQQSRRVEAGV